MKDIIHSLSTEQQNIDSLDIDRKDTIDVLKTMNNEDKKVAYAVEESLDDIALAVDKIAERMKRGGRLLYFGAGTSGRLAVIDAAECPPTFGIDSDMVQGIMAGGQDAIRRAQEDVEDNMAEGALQVEAHGVTEIDSIIGISASGQAAYVVGAVKEAKRRGTFTASISCNEASAMNDIVDIPINVVVGPEVIMGSTRLKSGTAQKMVLNMISTGVMIRLGKVYKNLMVDMKPNNKKLVERSKRIIMLATDVSYDEAEKYFNLSRENVKAAIVMIETGADYETVSQLLTEEEGMVSKAIESYRGI